MTAIGIDLGTTNSATATFDGERGTATVLTNGKGENLTPSAVMVRRRPSGERQQLVGRDAVNWADRQPEEAIRSIKRLMGRDFTDPIVVDSRSRLSYQVVPGPGGDPRAHVVVAGEPRSPAQVSALILEKLREDSARTLGRDVTGAVITVPAYFREAQRAATREAGEEAGLTVKKIIDEPTAAAVAFGLRLEQGERRRILVYDLGGGTFDISILNAVRDSSGRNQFQVLTFDGDSWLGGDDFDLVLVDQIVAWVKEQYGVDPSADPRFRHLAKKHAEEAKRELSSQPEGAIMIPGLPVSEGGPEVDVDMTIGRAEFDALIEPLVTRTMDLVRGALERQNLAPEDITDVLLVGGSTLTPKVHETVEAFFGRDKVRRDVNPMECVALGAGVLAGTLHGVECAHCSTQNEEGVAQCAGCGTALGATRLYEVTGSAVGIAAVEGDRRDVFVPMIERGTPYPLAEPRRRSFQATDGRFIRIPLYEGESAVASENQEQGVLEYELPEEIEVGATVEVALNYDADRTFTVTVSVPGSGISDHTAQFRHNAARSAPAASPRGEEAAADDDGDPREELENLIQAVRAFVQRYEAYIDPAKVARARRDADRAEQALELADHEECRRLCEVLRTHIVDSGMGTQLYLAEIAAERTTPENAHAINEAVTNVQRSFREGNADQVGTHANTLRAMVAQAFEDSDVDEVSDAVDLGGLLKLR